MYYGLKFYTHLKHNSEIVPCQEVFMSGYKSFKVGKQAIDVDCSISSEKIKSRILKELLKIVIGFNGRLKKMLDLQDN